MRSCSRRARRAIAPERAAALAALLAVGAAASARPARAWDRPIPHAYGRVVLDNFSRRAGVPPVHFDHWSHRARHTCRLCHVDVGFAMSAGATRVSAATNRDRFHCGACHDGKSEYRGRTIFAACSGGSTMDERCRACHGAPDSKQRQRDYDALAATLPRDRLGLVDWARAEAERLVRPLDHVEGLSIQRRALGVDREVSIESNAPWMRDIVFSHRKHTVWNGCEVCHPEIFPAMKGGAARYTMLHIANGQYCGVCHDKVAFPLADCGRCHVRPVR